MMQLTTSPSVWTNSFSPELVDIKSQVWGEWADSIESLVMDHDTDFTGGVQCTMADDGKLYLVGTLDNGQISMMSVHPDDWSPKHRA